MFRLIYSVQICLFLTSALVNCESEPQCPVNDCTSECEHGYEVDDKGCPTCVCRAPDGCSPVMCLMHCPFGWEKDDNGCDMCRCNWPEN